MRFPSFAVAALAAAVARPALAQTGAVDPQCAAAIQPVRDACQKSIDLFNIIAPQLGTALAGGNAVLGQGGAFGRTGRFSIGLRATAFQGNLPEVSDIRLSTTGPQRSDFATRKQWFGAPAVEGALGLVPSLPLGPIHFGGVDALVTATYVPEYDDDDFSVSTPGGSLKLGYGARVGLIRETLVIPSVAVTFLRRDLPTTDVVGVAATTGAARNDTLGVRGLSLKTDAWRVVAGKRLAILDLAVGAGQDRYRSRAQLGAVVNETVAGFPALRFEAPEVRLRQSLTRTTYFADLGLNLPGIRIVGEVGRTSGGDVATPYNSFDGGSTTGSDALTYVAAGLRFGF